MFSKGEEKILNDIGFETSRLGGALFRSQQMLTNWKNDQKVLEVDFCFSETISYLREKLKMHIIWF